MKIPVGRGYQQFFTGIIRRIETRGFKILAPGWEEMITKRFKPVDLLEQNWLLDVDPSKSQSDKIQDRMEQFSFKM